MHRCREQHGDEKSEVTTLNGNNRVTVTDSCLLRLDNPPSPLWLDIYPLWLLGVGVKWQLPMRNVFLKVQFECLKSNIRHTIFVFMSFFRYMIKFLLNLFLVGVFVRRIRPKFTGSFFEVCVACTFLTFWGESTSHFSFWKQDMALYLLSSCKCNKFWLCWAKQTVWRRSLWFVWCGGHFDERNLLTNTYWLCLNGTMLTKTIKVLQCDFVPGPSSRRGYKINQI